MSGYLSRSHPALPELPVESWMCFVFCCLTQIALRFQTNGVSDASCLLTPKITLMTTFHVKWGPVTSGGKVTTVTTRSPWINSSSGSAGRWEGGWASLSSRYPRVPLFLPEVGEFSWINTSLFYVSGWIPDYWEGSFWLSHPDILLLFEVGSVGLLSHWPTESLNVKRQILKIQHDVKIFNRFLDKLSPWLAKLSRDSLTQVHGSLLCL